MDNPIDYFHLEELALPGAFSRFDMEAIVPEIVKLEPGQIYVEIGVDQGRSLAIARQFAKKGVYVYGVDLRPNPNIGNTVFFQGDSVVVAKDIGHIVTPAIIFIDGDHSYEGCKRDIEAWYPHMAKNGLMFFHDCDETSPGVVDSVNEFVKNHQVKEFKLFKTPTKNTSMALIRL